MSGSRWLALGTIFAIVVLTGSPALAKGASSATVTGPGIDEPIEILDYPDHDLATRDLVVRLMDQTSIWYATNSVVAIEKPAELGEPYRLSWSMMGPGDRVIEQFIYPITESGPVIHIPEQAGLAGWGSDVTGWYQASPELVETLMALGVPIDQPVSPDLIAVGVAFVALVTGFIYANSRRSPVVSHT